MQQRLFQLPVSSQTDPQSTLLIEQYHALSNGITKLKISYSQQCSQFEETNAIVNEKRNKLTVSHVNVCVSISLSHYLTHTLHSSHMI